MIPMTEFTLQASITIDGNFLASMFNLYHKQLYKKSLAIGCSGFISATLNLSRFTSLMLQVEHRRTIKGRLEQCVMKTTDLQNHQFLTDLVAGKPGDWLSVLY